MHCSLRIATAVVSLIALAGSSKAALILDDHFTGNSGGVPANWAVPSNVNSGTVVESGTEVSMSAASEDGIAIVSDASYSPQGVQTTVVVTATIDADAHAIFGIVDGSPVGQFLIADLGGDGSVRVAAANSFAGEPPQYLGSNIPSFTGGTLQVTLVFDSDSFSLSTDFGSYTTGDILYASVPLTGFSFSGLGTSMHPALSAGGTAGSAAFDRITLTTAVPEPETAMLTLIGAAAGARFLRRRR